MRRHRGRSKNVQVKNRTALRAPEHRRRHVSHEPFAPQSIRGLDAEKISPNRVNGTNVTNERVNDINGLDAKKTYRSERTERGMNDDTRPEGRTGRWQLKIIRERVDAAFSEGSGAFTYGRPRFRAIVCEANTRSGRDGLCRQFALFHS